VSTTRICWMLSRTCYKVKFFFTWLKPVSQLLLLLEIIAVPGNPQHSQHLQAKQLPVRKIRTTWCLQQLQCRLQLHATSARRGARSELCNDLNKVNRRQFTNIFDELHKGARCIYKRLTKNGLLIRAESVDNLPKGNWHSWGHFAVTAESGRRRPTRIQVITIS
jgi:hypothetical protein